MTEEKVYKTKVLIVGAGFSGLCTAIQLQKHGINDYIIVEKSDQIGGTWWENQYPGAECDVESHLYCYSFEPYPDWSRVYSGSQEIHQYIVHCATKYNLFPHCHLEEIITEAEFVDDKFWRIKSNKATYEAQFAVFSSSPLHYANIPDIPGIKDYTGKIIHTSKWDSTYDFTNKHIGMIGCAASGIQCAPHLQQKTGAHLTIFQRTPQWILPKGNRNFTALEKWIFRAFPWYHHIYRNILYCTHELFFNIFYKDSLFGRISSVFGLAYMWWTIRNADLRKRITPKYPMGCKRILASDDFFQSIDKPNVEVVTTPIERITKDAVVSEGKEHKVDVIVLATGFDLTGGISALKFTNAKNQAELTAAAKDPREYYGVYLKNVKNFFSLLGYNSGSTYTSVVLYVESQVNHVVKMIQYMDKEKKQTVQVTPQVFESFNKELEEKSTHLVLDQCRSWYVKDGRNFTIYPDTVTHFDHTLSAVSLEKNFIFE